MLRCLQVITVKLNFLRKFKVKNKQKSEQPFSVIKKSAFSYAIRSSKAIIK